MTEFGHIISYNRERHAGIIEAERDGAQVQVDHRDIETSGLSDLKRGCRVAFERVTASDGHDHARKLTMLQPIGAGATHRHIGDRRWTGASRNPL